MQTLRLLGIHALLIAVCALAAAQHRPSQRETSRVLLTANAVHATPPEQAEQKFPVRLRAVVTYYDPYIDTRHGALFVHDDSGGVFVSVPLRPILPLHAGDLVSVDGVTGPGDYAAIVIADRVTVIGASHLPAHTPRATLTEMQAGKTDGQWIEIVGRVRSAHIAARNVFLEIATDGGSLSAASVREAGIDYEKLVGSIVRIHGNAAPQFNKRRQMVGVHIFFPSLHEIYVIKPAAVDPFAAQPVPVSQLFRYSSDPSLLDRVHVRGRVTLNWPGSMLCIEDARDGICMETTQATAVPIGTLVDVVGFPMIHQFKPTLEDAAFRPARGSSQPLAPVIITGGEMPSDALDGTLVQVEGELIGKDLEAENPTLMLRSGEFIFPAILPKEESIAALRWQDGSTIRLQGICSVEVDPLSTNLGEGAVRAGSMRLLLQDSSDVVVMRAPSWWTPEHAVGAFAGAGLVMLASFAWIVVLGYRVEQQTEALRNSEARLRHLSEHDALTGLPNRMLLSDRLLTALLRVERFGGCLGLLMVDADGFKQINDRYGHRAGDMLLCELASRLTNCVRATDTIARIGGDEFIALLPDLHTALDAEAIAAKIIDVASRPVKIDETEVAVTVSIGVVTYPEGGKDSEQLMLRADAAMYEAKQRGKNGFRIYGTWMKAPARGEDQPARPSPQVPVPAGNA